MHQGILFLLLLTAAYSHCSFTVSKTVINRPGQLTFQFNRYKQDITVCFELDLPLAEQEYLLRLDYLPFQCLTAKNDVKMDWNKQKEKYNAQVQIGRQCKKRTLAEDEEEQEGYDKGGILAYKELVHKYLPTLVAIFFISLIAERFIFGYLGSKKDKTN